MKKTWVIMPTQIYLAFNQSHHYSHDHHHHHLDHTLMLWIILQSYPVANVYENTDDRKENKMKGKEDTKQSEPKELLKNELHLFLSIIFIYIL